MAGTEKHRSLLLQLPETKNNENVSTVNAEHTLRPRLGTFLDYVVLRLFQIHSALFVLIS